jgi:hypothetical protein
VTYLTLIGRSRTSFTQNTNTKAVVREIVTYKLKWGTFITGRKDWSLVTKTKIEYYFVSDFI